jgi:membrane-associated protease RseP (regulator of RpoE activity)
MRTKSFLAAALACAVLAPAAAEAQVSVRVTHRGVLGIMTQATGPGAEQRVIVDVVPESPAQKAGVVKGDTLVAINGQPATDRAMRTPFEPGDTVVLRVRRAGQNRDINVVAGERSGRFESFSFEMLPDSIMRQVAVIMRNVATELDTLRLPRIVVEGASGDSVFEFRFRDDDSTRVFRFVRPDMHIDIDSVRMRAFEIGERARVHADSLREHILRNMDERTFEFDTVRFMRPGEIFVRGMSVGLRSVAGAELAELNPGLAEYFRASEGVLVLNARDGTPAARAGLAAGDVIIQANGADVRSIPDLRRAVEGAGHGTAIRLRVLRRGQPVELSLGTE